MRFVLNWTDAIVAKITDVSKSVRAFEITPLDGRTAPYAPGSHMNVSVMVAGQPEQRSYSLVGEPKSGTYKIAVKKVDASKGGSNYMWGLKEGARIQISDPHNLFAIEYGRPEYILLAGGIGITPIVSMAAALKRAGANYRVIYSGRSQDDMAFVEDMKAAHGERFSTRVSDDGNRLDIAREIAGLAEGGQIYLCGPMRLLDSVRRAWGEANRHPADFRFETFASGGKYAPEEFVVKIPRLGLEVKVPENESMLVSLRKAGVDMMSDCERGECGLCAVDILAADGEIDHRDVFFSEHEKSANTQMCACVSRVVKGSVTIDTSFRPEESRAA